MFKAKTKRGEEHFVITIINVINGKLKVNQNEVFFTVNKQWNNDLFYYTIPIISNVIMYVILSLVQCNIKSLVFKIKYILYGWFLKQLTIDKLFRCYYEVATNTYNN